MLWALYVYVLSNFVMPPKRNVTYVKQEEPAFLKRFKERVGYKEGPSIETKRQALCRDDDDDEEDKEDEKPTVVVLKEGDLTEEEAERLRNATGANDIELPHSTDVLPEEPDETASDGKIIFKKPSKRKKDDKTELNTSTKKQKSDDKSQKKSSSSKQIKNSSLLSFNEDEDEDV